MVVKIKSNDSPEKIKKQLQVVEDKQTAKRIEQLKPFFGSLKLDVDPLKLQKKWRNEWE